ncbi:MAG: hypothetical protein IRZ09_01515 [Variibacter sp.]|nr:hypothetical protein [Variibacter sp.]
MRRGLDPTRTVPDHEQKRLAVGYVKEAWTEGLLEGIDPDCLAQACLFTALAELVATYGEEATARYAAGLSARILSGEFSVRPRQ